MSVALLLSATACITDGNLEEGGRAEVRVSFSLDRFSLSRSSSGSDESEVKTIQLFVADRSGDIVAESFQTGTDALSFKGRVGESYHLYAFANNPSRIEGLETEGDIQKWEYHTDLSEHFPHGFPMAGELEWTVTERNSSVNVELTRLVAKLQLTLDCSEMNIHGSFTLNSVRLRNCPSIIKPFLPAQKAATSADVGDGDSASADDIANLNAGESVVFYVLENMQGDLLPSNTDPWDKTPSSLSTGENVCTYLEASGTYASPGYNGKDSYRMYLGADNTKNFDLCRNSLYRLTLSPTEGNMRKDGNWKITASDWSDSRKIYFSTSSLKVLPGSSATTSLTFSPAEFEFSLTDSGLSDAGISYSVNGNEITVNCASDATLGKEGKLYARSWDGRVEATCTVHVGEGLVTYKEIIVTPDVVKIKVGESVQLKAEYREEIYMDGVYHSTIELDVTDRSDTEWATNIWWEEPYFSVVNGLVTGLRVSGIDMVRPPLATCTFCGGSGYATIYVVGS